MILYYKILFYSTPDRLQTPETRRQPEAPGGILLAQQRRQHELNTRTCAIRAETYLRSNLSGAPRKEQDA